MTFCLGMRVESGLIGIADTCVTSGSETITARKMQTYEIPTGRCFIMTSGLRSVRDKASTYFDEVIEEQFEEMDRTFKVVNAFAQQIRRVDREDRESLEPSGLNFNIHALVGGRMNDDREHKLYLIYPQGNWVEIGPGTPYAIIGSGTYGKPVMDRALQFTDTIHFALKVGCLAFDSTRISAADVDLPIDVVVLENDSHRLIEHRYHADDLREISEWWQDRIRIGVNDLPDQWTRVLLDKLEQSRSSLRLP